MSGVQCGCKGEPPVCVQHVVSRRRTGYKDKNGKPIREGDTVGTWMSTPWDEEVPIFRIFKVEKEPGVGWMCKGEQNNDEDDLLKNFKHLKIQKTKPANQFLSETHEH